MRGKRCSDRYIDMLDILRAKAMLFKAIAIEKSESAIAFFALTMVASR
jgi:hypothetical protein